VITGSCVTIGELNGAKKGTLNSPDLAVPYADGIQPLLMDQPVLEMVKLSKEFVELVPYFTMLLILLEPELLDDFIYRNLIIFILFLYKICFSSNQIHDP